jgi:hypothetical protein
MNPSNIFLAQPVLNLHREAYLKIQADKGPG